MYLILEDQYNGLKEDMLIPVYLLTMVQVLYTLLVVGGMGGSDSWLFDINKRIWKQLVSINITCTMSVIMMY